MRMPLLVTLLTSGLGAVVATWPLGQNEVAVPDGPHVCTTAMDCSLNGDCVRGRCVCDAAWSGGGPSNSEVCDVLNIVDSPAEAYAKGGYHNATESAWGGNVVYTSDEDGSNGVYHLFVAQMANSCGLGSWGTNSMIIRAESTTSPTGPFAFKEVVVGAFSHNPTIRRSPHDGAYYLFMIGDGGADPEAMLDCTGDAQTGVTADAAAARASGRRASAPGESGPSSGKGTPSGIYVTRAESVYGPWSPLQQVVFAEGDGTSPMLCQGHTNPSPHFNADGSVHLAFQAAPCDDAVNQTLHYWALVGVAVASSWNATDGFHLTSPDPVTPHNFEPTVHPACIAGVDEDPFLYRTARGFHILTHGMCPSGVRQAHYKFSTDGVHWATSPRQTYPYTTRYTDGTSHVFARVERPQLLFGTSAAGGIGEVDPKTGQYASPPTALFNAVCGTGDGQGSDFECVFDQMTGHTWWQARPLAS